jgi:ABC-2 type transporter
MYARYFDIPREVAARRADELLEFVRRLTIARRPDQRTRSNPARRADHRPRSAGASRDLGSATSFSALFVCITTFVRKIEDFDIVIGLAVMTMFLFSGTFFPVSRVPLLPRIIIELLPLYHGTAMLRQLTTGAIDRTLALHVAYLVILGATAFAIAMRRLERALIK